MKCLLLSTSDGQGGAARAALRVNQSLSVAGVDSTLGVRTKTTDNRNVLPLPVHGSRLLQKLAPGFDQLPVRHLRTENSALRSPAWIGSLSARQIRNRGDDLVNVHWINGGFISVSQIAKISVPVVFTLHDMWSFCGTHHYANEETTAIWRSGAGPETLRQEKFEDFWIKHKRHRWRHLLHAVAPSRWMADCARSSRVMAGWRLRVIPYPLNLELFRPVNRGHARDLLGVPQNRQVILFGALGGTRDPRKGWDLLVPALRDLAHSDKDKWLACVVGESFPEKDRELPFDVKYLGNLQDDLMLVLAYSAADVVVVPSRQENLGQFAIEATACGRAVVAYNVGGFSDIVEHQITGYLSPASDSKHLADGIRWVVHDPLRQKKLEEAARSRAVELWSFDRVGRLYLDFFEQILDERNFRAK